jgi:hypothetical protein
MVPYITPDGKADHAYRPLSQDCSMRENTFVAPRTEIESSRRDLIVTYSGSEGRHTYNFLVGGDGLSATRVIIRSRNALASSSLQLPV